MSEQVIRHRGGGRDENGKWVEPSNVPLTPTHVAPGGGSEYTERGRAGETVECVVYFAPGTDLTGDDELTVRGKRYPIIVNDWRASGRGGLEVLCTMGQG